MSDPNVQVLSPQGLAERIFDAVLLKNGGTGDPREVAREVIVFLRDALVYSITLSAGDEGARKALLKSIGDQIIEAPPLARGGTPTPVPTSRP